MSAASVAAARLARMMSPGVQPLRTDCRCHVMSLIEPSASQALRAHNLRLRMRAVSDVLTLLDDGTKNRHIGETRMNRESSRSHCVLICSIQSRRVENGVASLLSSRLNLVDLAGSEAQKASGAIGERLREASGINKSLSILGRVINSLSQQQKSGYRAVQHVPYRDSKLTFLLQVGSAR